jgi:hypothetical protein
MKRTTKNKKLYLKEKIMETFNLQLIKYKREIRKLEKTVKTLTKEKEEAEKNNEFLFEENKTLKTRLRKKMRKESEAKKLK